MYDILESLVRQLNCHQSHSHSVKTIAIGDLGEFYASSL